LGAPSCVYIYIYLVGGLEHEFYFSISWEFHHPNWRSLIFFRGVEPPTIYIYIIWIINDYNPFTMCGMQIQVLVPIWTSVPCLACRAVPGLDRVRNHLLNFSIEFPLDSILRMPPFNLVVLNGYIFISRLQTFSKFGPYMQDHPT